MVWVKSSQPWKYFLKSWSDCIILFEAQFAILNRLHRAILPLTFIPNCITATAQFSNYNKCFALTITIKTVLHALVTTFFFQQMFCHPLLCPSPFFLPFFANWFSQNAFNYVVIASEIFVIGKFVKRIHSVTLSLSMT